MIFSGGNAGAEANVDVSNADIIVVVIDVKDDAVGDIGVAGEGVVAVVVDIVEAVDDVDVDVTSSSTDVVSGLCSLRLLI